MIETILRMDGRALIGTSPIEEPLVSAEVAFDQILGVEPVDLLETIATAHEPTEPSQVPLDLALVQVIPPIFIARVNHIPEAPAADPVPVSSQPVAPLPVSHTASATVADTSQAAAPSLVAPQTASPLPVASEPIGPAPVSEPEKTLSVEAKIQTQTQSQAKTQIDLLPSLTPALTAPQADDLPEPEAAILTDPLPQLVPQTEDESIRLHPVANPQPASVSMNLVKLSEGDVGVLSVPTSVASAPNLEGRLAPAPLTPIEKPKETVPSSASQTLPLAVQSTPDAARLIFETIAWKSSGRWVAQPTELPAPLPLPPINGAVKSEVSYTSTDSRPFSAPLLGVRPLPDLLNEAKADAPEEVSKAQLAAVEPNTPQQPTALSDLAEWALPNPVSSLSSTDVAPEEVVRLPEFAGQVSAAPSASVPATALQAPIPVISDPKIVQTTAHLIVSQAEDRAEVLLEPAELGRLRFEITQRGDGVQILLMAERPETLDLLRRNADQLLGDLKAMGFSGSELGFGSWQNEGHHREASDGTEMTEDEPILPLPLPQFGGSRSAQRSASGGLDLRL